jgi:uncharacterized protein (DUF362 family)
LTGAWAAAAPLLRWKVLAGEKPAVAPAYSDLVAVKDGSPVQMFELGIETMGGMNRFVKAGQTVLVKPNIGWNKTPVEGATTNPELVGRIVELARKAGAKKVYCTDHSVHPEKECFERSGIKKAVESAGGEMRSSDDAKYYREIKLPKAKILKSVLVHELYLDSDVVINVPILKSHGGGRVTGALKNLMGVVWDRGLWHREGLQQAIGEFCLVRKPDLNIVDAYIVMMTHGPLGASTDDLLLKKMQLLSTDPVLADTAGAKILEIDPNSVEHFKVAAGLGLGSMDLDKKSIQRLTVKA